jgi:DNA-directed RNA polymerase subunit RPC12/RpoP
MELPMDEYLTINENTCSQCGHRLDSPEHGLAMDGDHMLCSQCYHRLLVPGHKANQMENLD